MKLKNKIILALQQQGLQATTEHEVPVKDAYKAFKFRSEIEKKAKEIEDKRPGLVKSAGIEDGEKFDKRITELRAIKEPKEAEKKELDDMTAKLKKFNDLYNEMLEDETELEGVKAMSYESYHALAKENKQTPVVLPGKEPKTIFVDLFTAFQAELEGILWEAPKDEE